VGLDLSNADYVSFRLLMGGGSCETVDYDEDVVLEYRTSIASASILLQIFPSSGQYNKETDNNKLLLILYRI
jgi:hypothetical protein